MALTDPKFSPGDRVKYKRDDINVLINGTVDMIAGSDGREWYYAILPDEKYKLSTMYDYCTEGDLVADFITKNSNKCDQCGKSHTWGDDDYSHSCIKETI